MLMKAWLSMSSAGLALFASERVLDSADGVLDFALGFVSLAFGDQFGVADGFADRGLDRTFDLVGHAGYTIFIHNKSSRVV